MHSSILKQPKPIAVDGMPRQIRVGDDPLSSEALAPVRTSEPLQPEPLTDQWGLGKRILFRFTLVYVALDCVRLVLSLPAQFFGWWPQVLWQPYSEASSAVVRWVADHVFRVELPARLGARGDITADYVQLFCYLVLAAAAASAWS